MQLVLKLIVLVSVLILNGETAFCQGAGYGAQNSGKQYLPAPRPNTSEYIAVRGRSEISVAPESLRLVFAVTSESDTTQDCVAKTGQTIKEIREGLNGLKIQDEEVVEDFIVMTPTYEWKLEQKQKDEVSIAKETESGFRMQTNLHVLCKNEAQANEVMLVAFENGVHEIISFDYYHSNLGQFKKEATKKAIADAHSKSELLLSVLDKKPEVLNIDHVEQIRLPQSQYRTITQKSPNSLSTISRDLSNLAKLPAYRPKLTFYAGSRSITGSTSYKPAMKPEIIVMSEVVLTFSSPRRDQGLEILKEQIKLKLEAKK